ncbi:MAG: replication-associated recombination protein A [Chloroflexi bacterium]|nr:replication-associated recombination protein A [Chloroflexota bacterium]
MPARKGVVYSLFDHARAQVLAQEAPLAHRMRPRSFDDFVGQEHIVGEGRVLRRAIESDQLPSVILWGPPGSGKTTLAMIVAQVTRSHFEPVSAVTSGVADLRRIIDQARERRGEEGQRTILFIDEIHRFNKAQQDVVLPHVEQGGITLIGATTENPSFEVNSPLLSRCRVFTLKPLTNEQVQAIVERALGEPERGLGNYRVQLEDNALQFLVDMANGDARVALNALEMAAFATEPDAQSLRHVGLPTIEDALQHRALLYDRAGDQHYDTISAYIKSVRGSDPDAALYWLGRMIEAGEDPLFIARRMVILAAEDVGMADPQALVVAVAAQQAVHFVGLPEGRIPLAEATVYLATAPKSNSAYMALERAMEDVRQTRTDPVPLHLRNPVTRLMRGSGYGKGYKYAHDFPGHYVSQQYLPDNLKGKRYYFPSDQGYERGAAARPGRTRQQPGQGKDEGEHERDAGHHNEPGSHAGGSADHT